MVSHAEEKLIAIVSAGLNIPGLNPKLLAEGYGATAFRAETPAELYQAMQDARRVDGPALIEFPINPKLEKLPV